MTITCAYSVEAVGSIPIATLKSQLAGVPLDTTLFELTGLTLNSDSTASSGSQATRTISVNQTATFISNFGTNPTSQAAAVRGWMTAHIQAALRSPVMEATPVVT
jgi:hypothetical protein